MGFAHSSFGATKRGELNGPERPRASAASRGGVEREREDSCQHGFIYYASVPKVFISDRPEIKIVVTKIISPEPGAELQSSIHLLPLNMRKNLPPIVMPLDVCAKLNAGAVPRKKPSSAVIWTHFISVREDGVRKCSPNTLNKDKIFYIPCTPLDYNFPE